jgi:hypothetical protein
MIAATNAAHDTVAVAKLMVIWVGHIMQPEYRVGNEAMWGGEHVLIEFFNVEPLSTKHRRSI